VIDSIEQLTAGIARGDERFVELFYRRYFDFLFAQARRALRQDPTGGHDEASCLDVVHDAMLRVVRCCRPMRTEAHLLNWCRVVVQCCALDRLRAESRRRRHERQAARHEEISEASTRESQMSWLAAQIRKLDAELVRLIDMRYSQGLTLARIAATVQMSVGGVDARLRRAIAILRAEAEDIESNA
jgi:RNA polymerase sigma factor (sigma-70 family)